MFNRLNATFIQNSSLKLLLSNRKLYFQNPSSFALHSIDILLFTTMHIWFDQGNENSIDDSVSSSHKNQTQLSTTATAILLVNELRKTEFDFRFESYDDAEKWN